MIRSLMYCALLVWTVFIIGACSSSQEMQQPRIPETKTKAPKYETDTDLRKRAVALETRLADDPENLSIRLTLASLYLEIDEEDKALVHMEYLKKNNLANSNVFIVIIRYISMYPF